MRVLVTGASGFVGRQVVARLLGESGVIVRAAHRGRTAMLLPGVEQARVDDLSARTDWSDAVRGCEAVVHAAARVHVMHETANALDEFRAVNVDGTLRLARQTALAGVRRFVFVSSIKVNGELTSPDRPFTAEDVPAPCDAYGLSKQEAEQGLRRLAEETGLEVAIVRPVLVYGPGVKANFLSMMRWLEREIPLPLGAISNRRSLVALDNLADLLVRCVTHPAAAQQTFLVSDGEDMSTTQLLRRTAAALGARAHLIPIPMTLLDRSARLLGRGAFANRVYGSLVVEVGKTRALLDWSPPVRVDEALAKTAEHFLRYDVR